MLSSQAITCSKSIGGIGNRDNRFLPGMIMINVRSLDLRLCAVVSLLVLWTALTFSIALTEIAFVCALVCWVGWHIQLKKGALKGCSGVCSSKFDWAFWTPLALFFLFVLISFFTSEYPKESFKGLFKIAKPLLVFVMVMELFKDTGSQKKFNAVFLGTFLMVTIDCAIQYAFGKDLLRGFAPEHSGAGIRLVGSFGNFAKMATYLVLVIPVFGMQFWSDFNQRGHRRSSVYSLALAFAALLLLYLTRCRGPVVALVLSFALLFIYKRWFKALGVTVILCLVLLAATPRHILIHQDVQKNEQSLNERYYLWRRAIDVITAKPFTGTGINTYDKAHAKYDRLRKKKYVPLSGSFTTVRQNQNGSISFITDGAVWTSDTEKKTILVGKKKYNIYRDSMGEYHIWNDLVARGYYAHNGYLQLAAEIGLFGIICFLWFFMIFFKCSLQQMKRVKGTPDEYNLLGLLTGLIAFLIYAVGDNNLQSPPSLMLFWFSAGVLTAKQNTS